MLALLIDLHQEYRILHTDEDFIHI